MIAALCAFLLLPGLHVLVHEHEVAQAAQAQALHASRARHVAHDHAGHHDAHDHGGTTAPAHRHAGEGNDGHGRTSPEHLAAALTLAPALPLLPPISLFQQLDPSVLIDRLASRPKVRAHATRAPPLC